MMFVDTFEPDEYYQMILPASPGTTKLNLNLDGFADYMWRMASGVHEQAERKHAGEVLSNIEGVEEQLRGEIAKVQDTILLIEDVAVPVADGIQTFVLNPNGRFFRPGRHYNMSYDRYESWLISLERVGVLVWRTASSVATVKALVQFERSAAVSEHTALQRYLKQHVIIKHDPQVETIMGLRDKDGKGFIGPERGQALIAAFGTVYNLTRATPEHIASTVPGVGIGLARKILASFGREDV